MTRNKPPFRADVVGSLLRTAPLKEARAKREKGEISPAQLAEVEDREIDKIIKKQEEAGLKVATDGEFRRSWWHFDFYGMLDGVEIYELDHGIQFQGLQTKPRSIRVHGKLGFSRHPMLDHFKYVKAHTRVTPKMCIPSPATMHFRLEPDAVTTKDYKDRDAIFDDLAKTYRQAIRGFYDAGCRYLQFDDTAWAYLCSRVELKKARDRGLNADRLQQDYARLINGAPAASSRCGFCPRATRSSFSASSPPSPARWRKRTTSSGASTRRRNSPRSISSACRRNAVSLRPKKAMCLPKTKNGRSC
jgi:5-methyltetrahydropteroyltriglutamate--homocysteine methyltransferase